MSANHDPGDYGQAGPQRTVSRHAIEDDLDRHALHDLDIVAGGIFRRQQCKGLTCAALNGIHVTLGVSCRAGIDADRDSLPGPNQVELCLLVIGRHPHGQGHDRHHLLSGVDVRTRCHLSL